MFKNLDMNFAALTAPKIKEILVNHYTHAVEVIKKPRPQLVLTLNTMRSETLVLVAGLDLALFSLLSGLAGGFKALIFAPIVTAISCVIGALYGFGLNHFFGSEKVTFDRSLTLSLYQFTIVLPVTIAMLVFGIIPYIGPVIGMILNIAVTVASAWLGFFGLRDVLHLSVKTIIISAVVVTFSVSAVFIVPTLMLYMAIR